MPPKIGVGPTQTGRIIASLQDVEERKRARKRGAKSETSRQALQALIAGGNIGLGLANTGLGFQKSEADREQAALDASEGRNVDLERMRHIFRAAMASDDTQKFGIEKGTEAAAAREGGLNSRADEDRKVSREGNALNALSGLVQLKANDDTRRFRANTLRGEHMKDYTGLRNEAVSRGQQPPDLEQYMQRIFPDGSASIAPSTEYTALADATQRSFSGLPGFESDAKIGPNMPFGGVGAAGSPPQFGPFMPPQGVPGTTPQGAPGAVDLEGLNLEQLGLRAQRQNAMREITSRDPFKDREFAHQADALQKRIDVLRDQLAISDSEYSDFSEKIVSPLGDRELQEFPFDRFNDIRAAEVVRDISQLINAKELFPSTADTPLNHFSMRDISQQEDKLSQYIEAGRIVQAMAERMDGKPEVEQLAIARALDQMGLLEPNIPRDDGEFRPRVPVEGPEVIRHPGIITSANPRTAINERLVGATGMRNDIQALERELMIRSGYLDSSANKPLVDQEFRALMQRLLESKAKHSAYNR